jgi:F-type H+/Na+-transporting ATPase subunit alpha
MTLIENIQNEILKQNLPNESLSYKEGVVTSFYDGVLVIKGLSSCSYLEEIETVSGKAIILEMDKFSCKAISLSDKSIPAGSKVRSYNQILSLELDPTLRGVVYDALGKIVLGNFSNLQEKIKLQIENEAPKLMDREPVSRPLNTGILSIDALANVGLGQRQLIIGDRQTGKTSIAIDTIINQKNKNITCIYVAIGQKQSTISRLFQTLKEKGALDYTVIFTAAANSSIAMQYLVPFSAVSLGQYLMEKGEDALIIYDDLTKHAVAWRQLSLLLKRPVGREAYPGDVFYLHSRLLERGGQLEEKVGGGSLTALPIIETQANDVTSYIATNVISITDGQIYLESTLFNQGIRPAISAGLSVSRVGGAAQSKAVKKNSGKLKLELSQYRELASFSQIGSGLDAKTKKVLDMGKLLTQILIQGNQSPLNVAQEVGRLRIVNLPKMFELKNKVSEILLKLDEAVINGIFGDISEQLNNGKWDDTYVEIVDNALVNFLNKI